jgi:hypothetical protein
MKHPVASACTFIAFTGIGYLVAGKKGAIIALVWCLIGLWWVDRPKSRV